MSLPPSSTTCVPPSNSTSEPSPALSTPEAELPRARLAAYYFAYFAIIGGYTPYFSVFLHRRGLDASTIGLMLSLWYATRVIAPGAWSWLAGRGPHGMRWLRVGALLMALGFAPMLWPLDQGGLIASLVAFAFFANAIAPQFEAIVLSHLPGRSEQYGSLRVWGSIGFIVVALGLGLLFDHLDARWLPALMLPWMALVCVLAMTLDYGPGQYVGHERAEGLRAILRRREVWGFILLLMLMQMAFGPYHMLYSLYLRERGYSAGAIGGLWAAGVGIEIVTFFNIAPLLLRHPPRRMMLAGLGSGALRWLAMALLPGYGWIMLLAQLTHALSFAAFYAAAMRLLARYFPGRLMGYGQGINSSIASGIGGVLGALLTAQLWSIGNGYGAFMAASALCLAGMLLALRVLPEG